MAKLGQCPGRSGGLTDAPMRTALDDDAQSVSAGATPAARRNRRHDRIDRLIRKSADSMSALEALICAIVAHVQPVPSGREQQLIAVIQSLQFRPPASFVLRTYESSTVLDRDSWAARLIARWSVGRRRAALSLLDVQRGTPPPEEIRLVSRRCHRSPRVGQPGGARHGAASARGVDASSASSSFFPSRCLGGRAATACGGGGADADQSPRRHARASTRCAPPAQAPYCPPSHAGVAAPPSTAGWGGRLTPAALHDVADAAHALVVGGGHPRLPTWHRQRAAAAAAAAASAAAAGAARVGASPNRSARYRCSARVREGGRKCTAPCGTRARRGVTRVSSGPPPPAPPRPSPRPLPPPGASDGARPAGGTADGCHYPRAR